MPSKNPNVAIFQVQRKRALELGNTGQSSHTAELLSLLRSDSSEVRRLAASALGKFADRRAGTPETMSHLFQLAREDPHPQVRQYAIKSLAKHGELAISLLDDLRDIARDASERDYVRTAAAEAIAHLQGLNRRRVARGDHWCRRCKCVIPEEDYIESVNRFGRPYCRHCFVEKLLEGRAFEATVEGAKKLITTDGAAVQSYGEKKIADWLSAQKIAYRYDERYRIAGDAVIRPDFYLPEFDLYIEYWGMDTPEYLENKRYKQFLYQRAAKKLISLSYRDFDSLEQLLEEKLSRYIR